MPPFQRAAATDGQRATSPDAVRYTGKSPPGERPSEPKQMNIEQSVSAAFLYLAKLGSGQEKNCDTKIAAEVSQYVWKDGQRIYYRTGKPSRKIAQLITAVIMLVLDREKCVDESVRKATLRSCWGRGDSDCQEPEKETSSSKALQKVKEVLARPQTVRFQKHIAEYYDSKKSV